MARGRPGPAPQTARRERFVAVGRAGVPRCPGAGHPGAEPVRGPARRHRGPASTRSGGEGVAGAGDRGRAGPGPGDGQPGTAPQPGTRVSGQYRPFTAQRLAVSRRARPGRDKLMRDPVLRQFVADRMGKRWRPKQISHAQRVPRQSRPAHRARDDLPGATPRSPEPSLAAVHPRAPQGHSQIYQAVRRTELGGLCRDLPGVLRTGRRRRKQRRRLGARRAGSLAGMTMIDQRPTGADSRDIPGHWECEWCCQATLARSGGAAA